MENIFKDIKEKAKKRSIEGIPIKYNGETILLDPKKVNKKIAELFAATAILVMAGVSLANSSKIKEVVTEVHEELDEMSYEKRLEKSLNHHQRSIIDNISVPMDPVAKRPDTDKFYEILAQKAHNDIIYVDAYVRFYGKDSSEVRGMLSHMSEMNGELYTNFDKYLECKGFENYDSFRKMCLKCYDQKYFQYLQDKKETNETSKVEENNYDFAKIVLESEDPNLEIYKMYTNQANQDMLNDVLTKLAFTENQEYNNLQEYVAAKGFNSIGEWQLYCDENKSHNEGRTM